MLLLKPSHLVKQAYSRRLSKATDSARYPQQKVATFSGPSRTQWDQGTQSFAEAHPPRLCCCARCLHFRMQERTRCSTGQLLKTAKTTDVRSCQFRPLSASLL